MSSGLLDTSLLCEWILNRDVAEQRQGSESGSVGMEVSGFEHTSPASIKLAKQVGLMTTILNPDMLRAWG